MKSVFKLIGAGAALSLCTAFAAEAPAPTFSIWGEPATAPLGFYDLIKHPSGQEYLGFTVDCLDGGSGPFDTFVIRARVFDAATGTLRYELTPSIESPNVGQGTQDCFNISVGGGVAASGPRRIIVVGLADENNGVIHAYSAETGAQLYKKQFPVVDGDYRLAGLRNTGTGEFSSVGNFLNTRSDQLRVTYIKGPSFAGPLEFRVSYYDVLSGNQIGEPISMTVPAPVLP